jgi:hypothetical protein
LWKNIHASTSCGEIRPAKSFATAKIGSAKIKFNNSTWQNHTIQALIHEIGAPLICKTTI